MKVAAIVPSAGKGSRLRSGTSKPFVKLRGKELLLYSLEALEMSEYISEIIIPASKENIPKAERLIKRAGLRKVKHIIQGGRHRAGSVKRGFLKTGAETDFVLVHDCARPFLTNRLISSSVKSACRFGASLCAVKVKPTIKEAGLKNFVCKTLERKLLWEAQTPQVFNRNLLEKAYKITQRRKGLFTDDTAIFESAGMRVKIVEGDYSNIKITTPEDLVIAEAILKSYKSYKG